MKYVYIRELERFGYTLTVVSESEDRAKELLINEYIRTYRAENDGHNPAEDMRSEDVSYLDNAIEDIVTSLMVLDEVNWF